MSSPAIAVEELGKSFREGFLMRKKVAIESLTFALMPGSIYGFLGPNGAGKTTTRHLLMGFLRPSHGRAFLRGLPAGDPASRRDVGFLPEVFAFDRFSTGLSLLARFDALAGGEPEGRDRRVREALDAVDLADAARRRIGTYSKGMTQRIGLAQALLRDPDVLLLDEPMSGMDPATRKTVLGLLSQRHDRGKTTLLSSHILADVESVADRVLIIDHGRMVAEGPLSSLASAASGSVILFADPSPARFDPLAYRVCWTLLLLALGVLGFERRDLAPRV